MDGNSESKPTSPIPPFLQLVCSGVQHFIKDGEEMVERTELHHTVRSTSQRSESYQTNELEPNTQYSCHLTSVAGRLESEPSTRVKFTTTPGSKCKDCPLPLVVTMSCLCILQSHLLLLNQRFLWIRRVERWRTRALLLSSTPLTTTLDPSGTHNNTVSCNLLTPVPLKSC